MIPEPQRALRCVACGACEEKCPQHLTIIKDLRNVAERFEQQAIISVMEHNLR